MITPKQKERLEIKEKIKTYILNSKQPCHLKVIAREVGCTDYLGLKLLLEILIEDLLNKNPEVLRKLEIMPLKTTNSVIFMSSEMVGTI